MADRISNWRQMNKQSFLQRPQAVLLSLALALGVGGVGFAGTSSPGYLHPPPALRLASPDNSPSHAGFAPVVKKVLPAVVNISSSRVSKIPTQFLQQMPDDPMFRQFFGNGANREFKAPQQAPEQREQGLGSGVIMSPDGYILTNNHVVEGATGVRVTLADKRELEAKVVGTDPKSDIAVLKIDATNLPCITVGDSSKVQVGDYALAIGDPFGVGQTVTMGIVSAMGRTHLGIEDYENFIQTDAPINPGNSGGEPGQRPRRTDRHQYRHPRQWFGRQSGDRLCHPGKHGSDVMDQIVRTGKVTRAYLGIVPQDVTPVHCQSVCEKDASTARWLPT